MYANAWGSVHLLIDCADFMNYMQLRSDCRFCNFMQEYGIYGLTNSTDFV